MKRTVAIWHEVRVGSKGKNQCNISQAVGYEKNNEKHICPNFNLNV